MPYADDKDASMGMQAPVIETTVIEAGGIPTKVLRCGAGAPLLLLHGAGPGIDAAMNWSSILPRLGRYFSCIAPDLVGFGGTALPDPLPTGPAAWAALRVKQVLGLLDALGLGRAHLIGNSRGGGALVLRLMELAPERCDRPIVMAGGGYQSAPPEPDSTGAKPAVRGFYDAPSVDGMGKIIPLFVNDLAKLPMALEDLAALRFRQAMAPGAEAAFKAMNAPGGEAIVADEARLAAFDRPVLLLHGAKDRLAMLDSSLGLLRLFPAAHLHVLPAAGHWSHIDQPGAYCALVADFLAGRLD